MSVEIRSISTRHGDNPRHPVRYEQGPIMTRTAPRDGPVGSLKLLRDHALSSSLQEWVGALFRVDRNCLLRPRRSSRSGSGRNDTSSRWLWRVLSLLAICLSGCVTTAGLSRESGDVSASFRKNAPAARADPIVRMQSPAAEVVPGGEAPALVAPTSPLGPGLFSTTPILPTAASPPPFGAGATGAAVNADPRSLQGPQLDRTKPGESSDHAGGGSEDDLPGHPC
jgi:hypothetical protein